MERLVKIEGGRGYGGRRCNDAFRSLSLSLVLAVSPCPTPGPQIHILKSRSPFSGDVAVPSHLWEWPPNSSLISSGSTL